jgi:hypothetical protein
MTNDEQGYNIGAIKHLLAAAFTDSSELRRFCRYRSEFRPILGRVSEGAGMDEHVDALIDYCESRLLWEELLAEVQALNPRQYARFEPQLRSTQN